MVGILADGSHPRDILPKVLAQHQYIAWITVTDAWVSQHTSREEVARSLARYGQVRNTPGRGEALIAAGVHRPSGLKFLLTQRYARERPDTGKVTQLGEVVMSVEAGDTHTDSPWAFGPREH
jgi:hypothetical protein